MESEIKAVRELLEATRGDVDQEQSFEAMREGIIATGKMMPVRDDVTVSDVDLGGISAERTTHANAGQSVVLHFHGGGYTIGHPESHRSLVAELAVAAGATAYSIDYSLAPEAPHPAAVNDALAAYEALLQEGLSAKQIVLSGDSAGGGLAVACALKLRTKGTAQPAALALLSPWVNLENTGWSYTARKSSDLMLNQDSLNRMAAAYAGDQNLKDSLISPVNADLSGLPPMLIQVGGDEMLLSDATTLAERAGGSGVAVNLEIWPEMQHVFQFMHPMLTPAREAVARMGGFIQAQTRR